MRTIFAVIVAFGVPSIVACFLNMETVPFAAVVGFAGTFAFIIATLIDKCIRTGYVFRGIALAVPVMLSLLAALLAGTEAKDVLLAMCFYLFVGCCSGAMAARFIQRGLAVAEPNQAN